MLIVDYTKTGPAHPQDLVDEAVERLPFTLSHPIRKQQEAMEQGQYKRAMEHLLDFFIISSSFVTFIFLRLLEARLRQLSEAGASHEAAHQALLRQTLEGFVQKLDMKRPLSFGDWVNDLMTPMLKTALAALPEHPLTSTFGQHIYVKGRNVLLGTNKVPSVVKIRNDFAGHSTVLSEHIYRQVVEQLEPRMVALLSALRPLTDCRFDIATGRYRITFPTPSADAEESIDLYPLVFVDNQDYRYVLHTLKDEHATFLSSNEEAVTLNTEELNADIDRSLQRILPSFDIARERNWEEIKQQVFAHSATYLARVYAEKKYNQELFVPRESLTRTLHQFWQSDRPLFPLLGEAGQGKTSQLCYWTEQYTAEGLPILVFNASDFSGVSLETLVRQVFGFSYSKPIGRHMDQLHRKLTEVKGTIYVFFDAINECLHYADDDTKPGPLALYEALYTLFIQPGYTRFKVLFTCRSHTWKNVIQPHLGDSSPHLFTPEGEEGIVRGFTNQETQEAYAIYQKLFQMHTPFEQLDRRIVLRLRDPLTLKFTASNFLGQELSADPSVYTSLAIYSQMADAIDNSYAGHRQRQIIQHLAESLLDSYLRGQAADSVRVDDIRAAVADDSSPLHPLATLLYKTDGVSISIAYAELLGTAERPVIKEVSRQGAEGMERSIQFVYERFLEYVLGEAFVRRYQKDGGPQAEHFVQALDSAETNVVFMGAMRNALLHQCLAAGNFDVLIDLEVRWSEDYRVLSLVGDTLNTLITENYEDQLFHLIPHLLTCHTADEGALIEEFNEIVKTIAANKADPQVIQRHKELSERLAPTIRLKKLASVSTVKGVLLTDYFNEGLYRHDAYGLLWQVMQDPIYDVRNDACMYAYYLSHARHTLGYTPLTENLTVRIVKEMFHLIRSRRLLYNALVPSARKNVMSNVETASRLDVMMIIDNVLAPTPQSDAIVADMLDELKLIFRYFTADLSLVRLFMPFFQIAMKRQVTFQSNYVNNAVEYQAFWEPVTFEGNAFEGVQWGPSWVPEVMPFCHHHHRFGRNNNGAECRAEEERWQRLHAPILSAYRTGDAFSHLVLERVLVIMGVSAWHNLRPIALRFFADDFRSAPYYRYCQMSMLYVLYQVGVQTGELNAELLDTYAREASDWTLACRGLFRGRHSDRANPTGLYKRNVMSWYAAVYCAYAGDGHRLPTDEHPVPAFRQLIDTAIAQCDRELLWHLIENISELITDMGHIHTALDLILYILQRFPSQEDIDRIEGGALANTDTSSASSRGGIYDYDLVHLVGNVFSTAKNYFPAEVDRFIQEEVVFLSFPGARTYREDILNYHPSGETLSDLMTHKFGNFLMHSLLNIEAVDNFAVEAIAASAGARDSFSWYEQVIRILVRHLFNKKL